MCFGNRHSLYVFILKAFYCNISRKRPGKMNNQKMHIGFFIPSLRGGGAERMFANLVNGFSYRDFKVDLILAQKEGPYLKDISKKVNIVDLKSSRVLKSLFPLVKYLRKKKPDILITTLDHVNIISIIAKIISRSPVKLIIRQAIYYKLSSARIKIFLESILYKKADKIIAISKGVKNSLRETMKIPEQKIKVIYNPVFAPSIIEKSKKEVNHPYFRNKQDKVILGAGRLSRQKDFSTLIRAFNKLRKIRKVRLIILGEGDSRKELEGLIKLLDLEESVSLPGFVKNPYAYMSKSDVFVLSSKLEGFGNVLVEAMACGVSIVSTNCQSGPYEILDGGKYGKLVPVGDVEKLSKAIAESLRDPTDKDILRNRAKVFSVESAVNKYQKIFMN